MREVAEKEINRFTCVADYDVRRITGQKPKVAPVSVGIVPSSPAVERRKKFAAKPSTAQTSIEFTPAHAELGDSEEEA